jgi:hypothetical protein
MSLYDLASNEKIFSLLAHYIQYIPDFIEPSMMKELQDSSHLPAEKAYSYLMATSLGLEIADNRTDRRFFEDYFPLMIKRLDPISYQKNSYCQKIRFTDEKEKNWELTHLSYKPYEAFVRNDPLLLPDGRIIPQIGFFDERFSFPAVLQNGREWMTITPNEMETMKEPIQEASGDVLTFGLGLGYFAFQCSEKENVRKVVVVEQDETVIHLFQRKILTHFSHPEKIELIHSEAFQFAEKNLPLRHFDLIFCDLWHDPSDGLPIYQKFKKLETLSPLSKWFYWIEKTLKLYF